MINHLSTAQYNKGSRFWLAEGTFTGSIYLNSSLGDRKYTAGSYFDKDFQIKNHTITIAYKNGSFSANNKAKGWLVSYNIIFNQFTSSQKSTNSYSNFNLTETNYTHAFNGGYFIDKFIPISKSLAIYGEVLGKIGFSFNNGKGISPAHDIHIAANANLGIRYFINKKIFVNGQASLANINLQSLTVNDKTSAKVDISSIMTINTISIAFGKSF